MTPQRGKPDLMAAERWAKALEICPRFDIPDQGAPSEEDRNLAASYLALRLALRDLAAAGSLFGSFMAFVDAGQEIDGDLRIRDDQVMVNYCGPGSSIFITAGDFRKFAAALAQHSAAVAASRSDK